MKTGMRPALLAAVTFVTIASMTMLAWPAQHATADDGPTPQTAQLVNKIYIPGISKNFRPTPSTTQTPSPRQTATATPRTTANPTLAPTSASLPTATPSGPTATPLPPGTVDLKINSIEVTQGTQTDQNSVPLVAGRTAVLRIYAQTSSSTATANVSLSIVAMRDGVTLPGSPLVIGPRTVSPAPTRGSLDTSYNITLPAAWLSGRVSLVATIDSAGAVAEADESNNSVSTSITFNAVPPLDVVIVPIRYNHTPNGQTYPAPTIDTISTGILQLYPVPSVSISWHAPVLFSGDLSGSNAWSTLLNQVTSLRQSEVGTNSPKLYYALVPVQNTTGRWFSSGIAGIGWLGGYRASVGLDLGPATAGSIAAHEVGHNLGRYHAPCGATSGLDSSYPYANGSIGQFGLNVTTLRVWSPGNPDNAKDVMSYCGPEWISDYTYTGLFNALKSAVQAQGVSVATASDGVLVRVDLPGTGIPALQPIYALSGVQVDAPTPSEFAIQLLDASGAVLVSQPVTVLQASAHDVDHAAHAHTHSAEHQDTPTPIVRSIQALMPRPAQPIAKVRLLQSNVMIAERAMTALAQGQSSIITGVQPDAAGVLRWGNADRAALVRLSTDDGATWTTLAVDVTGGELSLDLASLPAGTRRFSVVLADAP